MGVLFWLFSYVTCYISIVAVALCITSGLYLLAEITEEYPTMTCKVLKYLAACLSLIQVVLWIDGLPHLPCIVQLLAYGAYVSTLQNFPYVQFVSIQMISSLILFLVTNGLWLHSMINSTVDAVSTLGFFLVVVWALPCGMFISLSANDFMLPGLPSQPIGSNGIENVSTRTKQKSIFRSSFDALAEHMYLVPGVGTVLNMYRMMADKKR